MDNTWKLQYVKKHSMHCFFRGRIFWGHNQWCSRLSLAWLYTEKSFLTGSGLHRSCWESNPGQSHARHTYCIITLAPHIHFNVFFSKTLSFCCLGPHLGILRAYSWLCTQETLWAAWDWIWIHYVKDKHSIFCTIASAPPTL